MAAVTPPASGSDDARWKARYLSALDEQERLESDAGTRISELGALLTRLGRALPASESVHLCKSLERVAGALKRDPLNPRTKQDLGELRGGIVEVMEACERERDALNEELERICEGLEGVCSSRRFQRRLKSFRATLSRRSPPAPSSLVRGCAELQELALDGASAPRLEAVQQPVPARVEVPLEGTGLAAEEAAAEGPALAPVEAPERAPVVRLVTGSPPPPVPDAPGAPASAMDFDLTRAGEALRSLVGHMDVCTALSERVSELESRLKLDLTAESLVELLEETRDLGHAVLSSLAGDYQRYLDEVERRLDGVLGGLGEMRAGDGRAEHEQRDLTESVQAGLQAMRGEAAAATRLDVLKSSIDQRLEALVESVDALATSRERRVRDRDASLAAMERRLGEMEQETRNAREQLARQRELARTDALTHLPNRHALDERLASEVQGARESGSSLSVAIADIDHFKRVNDRFGHAAGDRALIVFARILTGRTRQTDFCARYGGEEFVLLFPDTGAEDARGVLEQLRAYVESCGFGYRGEPVPITASFGITALRPDDDAGSVLERADQALYQAKNDGRNRVVHRA